MLSTSSSQGTSAPFGQLEEPRSGPGVDRSGVPCSSPASRARISRNVQLKYAAHDTPGIVVGRMSMASASPCRCCETPHSTPWMPARSTRPIGTCDVRPVPDSRKQPAKSVRYLLWQFAPASHCFSLSGERIGAQSGHNAIIGTQSPITNVSTTRLQRTSHAGRIHASQVGTPNRASVQGGIGRAAHRSVHRYQAGGECR